MTFKIYTGIVGIILSLGILYHSYRAIENFKKQGGVSLALNIPHGNIQKGLKLMLIGFLVLVAAMILGRWGRFLNLSFMQALSDIGIIITVFTILVFLRALSEALRKI